MKKFGILSVLVLSLCATSTSWAKGKLFDKVEVSKKRVAAKGKKYSWANAYAFAIASQYAYDTKVHVLEKGRALTESEKARERFEELGLKFCSPKQKTEYKGLVPADKIRDKSWSTKWRRLPVDTQYYLVYNDKMVAVLFRGSESGSFTKFLKDWINTDARLLWAEPWDTTKRVHRGFYWAYASVRVKQNLVKRVNNCRTLSDPSNKKSRKLHKPRALFFAGHSLGGAVASLAALDMNKHDKIPVRGVYTYGSPRPFGQKSAAHYRNKLTDVTHRWVNKNDMVTGLPAPGFHRHVGRLHHIKRGTINKGKQLVVLDRAPIAPRVPAFWDHYMGNYIQLIWKYMPNKTKRSQFGSEYKSFSESKLMKLGGYPKANCQFDNDCGKKKWCDRGTLYVGANHCQKKKKKGSVCIRDGQCTSGTCNLLFMCGKNDGCEKDKHCGKGKWCDGRLGKKNLCRKKRKNGKLCERDGQCKSGECNILFTCVKKKKKKNDGCEKDKHCGKSKWCDGRLGKKNLCKKKKKNGKSCSRDGQCKSGQCDWKFKCAKK